MKEEHEMSEFLDSIRGDVVSNFPWKNLGDVCENLDKSRIPITKSKRVEGDIPYYGASGIVDYVEDYLFDEDLLLVSEDGANLLARTYPIAFSIKGKTWVNNHAHVLRFTNMLNQRFIEYFLNSIKLDDYVSGMAQPKLNQKSLNGIPVPDPSTTEQKQIVATLDQAFAAIDQAQANIQQNIQNAQDLFQSKLNQIFSQQGVGWEEEALSEFIDISHGYSFKSKDFEVDFQSNKPIVLTPGNFSESSTLYFTEKNTKRLSGEYSETLLFELGELVVVMTDLSSKMKILGKPSLIDQEGILHNQRIGRLIFKSDVVDKSYLYFYFQTSDYLKEIKSTATGTMVRHTAPKRILVTKIRFPNSLEHQNEYVRLIYSIKDKRDQLVLKYEKKLVDLEELKKSLLQKAFSGELTQDKQAA